MSTAETAFWQHRLELSRAHAARARVHDATDATAYDENGILRDGHTIRVKMTEMRDAAPPRQVTAPIAVPRVIGGNAEVQKELLRHFHRDGSKRRRRDHSNDFAKPVAAQDRQSALQQDAATRVA